MVGLPETPVAVDTPEVVLVEEAARPVGPTTLRSRAFISFVIMFGMGLAAWWPMMTYLSVFVRDVLDEGILAASFLMVAIHGVTATLGLASGPWIRKFGSKWTYVPGLVGLAAFMLVLGVVTDFTFVLVAAPVMGFFLAFHWTGAQAYIIEASPPDRRGLGSGIATSVATLVPAISAPILGLIADQYEFGTMALVAFGIVATGLVITVLPGVRFRIGDARSPDSARAILKRAGPGRSPWNTASSAAPACRPRRSPSAA